MKKNTSFHQTLNHIGNELYYLRHLKKLKITAVSKDIGISHAVISRIENGRYESLTIGLLKKLADYYEIPIASLFLISNNDEIPDKLIEHMRSEIAFLRNNYLELLKLKIDKTLSEDI